MRRHLIDHHGTVWTDPAPGLGEALGYADPDFDLWNYAIRNLGAVEVAIDGDGAVVTLRTATAHQRAVSAAEEFLATLAPMPVRLRYEIGSWVEESCDDTQQAIGRLTLALADVGRTPTRIAFAAKSRRLETLSEMRLNNIETNDERLGLVFKKWRLSQGKFDAETAGFFVRFGLLDRSGVVSQSPSSGELIMEHAGTAFYPGQDNMWSFRAKGAPLAAQPDPDYGRWIDRTYRSVLDQQRPSFDFVDAVIQPRKDEPYRSRYDRLLLPWRNANGLKMVTVTSYQTGDAAMALQ